MSFTAVILVFAYAGMIATDLCGAVKVYRLRNPIHAFPEMIMHMILFFEAFVAEKACREGFLFGIPTGRDFNEDFDRFFVFILIASLIAIYDIITLKLEYVKRITSINPSSFGIAAEMIDCGLLFAETDGTPVLVNARMRDISRRIIKKDRTYAANFWDRILKCEDQDIIKTEFAGNPTFIMQDGDVISFSRTKLSDGRKEYYEILAQDVTELYKHTEELKEQNTELEKVEERLAGTYSNVADLRQERELLSYKLHIHDELGNSVLKGARLLDGRDIESSDIDKLCESWTGTLNNLMSNVHQGESTGENIYMDVINTAKALGVRLILKGDRPVRSDILSFALREAVYNSVKHAGADIVICEGKLSDNVYEFKISDNSRKTFSDIKEGGGLLNIRRLVEAQGGSFGISLERGVVLNITLPGEAK